MVEMARAEVFSPDEIACVHVMNRAVRRCFLLGDDPITGKNFDHRKVWMEKKLEVHAANFGIDLLGTAIMSNHFHLVLRSRPDVVETWDDTEVARRSVHALSQTKTRRRNSQRAHRTRTELDTQRSRQTAGNSASAKRYFLVDAVVVSACWPASNP